MHRSPYGAVMHFIPFPLLNPAVFGKDGKESVETISIEMIDGLLRQGEKCAQRREVAPG